MMETAFACVETPGVVGEIGLPAELAHLLEKPKVDIEFGIIHAQARVRESGPGDILISSELRQRLRLPLPGHYRIRCSGASIRIGPTVGVLAGAEPSDLNVERLRAMRNHFLVQAPRGGMFVAFDRRSLDAPRQSVEGFRLTAGGDWEPGEYPLPRVIFRRYGISLISQLPTLQKLGVTIFNERTFNKWETWQWLSADENVHPHVPETAELTGIDAVLAMLKAHPVVYLKPSWGSLGSQIVRVAALNGQYSLEASGEDRIVCPTEDELRMALAWRLPRPGIVQRGLELATVGGRLVDFRVVTQKDASGKWQVSGIVGRCGHAGAIVSNMATGGFPVQVDEALTLLFGSSPAVHFRRHEEIRQLAVAVGAALDRSGLLLGDLGLDIAYDLDDHPWLIEANNRDPDHNIGWEAGSWPLFLRFRSTPIDYACTLAGFPPIGDVNAGD